MFNEIGDRMLLMNICCCGWFDLLFLWFWVDGMICIIMILVVDLVLEIFILVILILVIMIVDDREIFLLGVSCIIIRLVFLYVCYSFI